MIEKKEIDRTMSTMYAKEGMTLQYSENDQKTGQGFQLSISSTGNDAKQVKEQFDYAIVTLNKLKREREKK